MNEERRSLGARLKDAREYLGLSQDDVARALRITRSAISLIESGQRKVDALELKRFAELYRRPASFFTDEEPVAEIKTVQHIARAAAGMGGDDQLELLRFAEYLQSRGKTRKDSR
jgi:transcriptional regulator with XRE-family HTH domain